MVEVAEVELVRLLDQRRDIREEEAAARELGHQIRELARGVWNEYASLVGVAQCVGLDIDDKSDALHARFVGAPPVPGQVE